MRLEAGQGRADENTSPTRKRGAGIIPSLRVGLVLTPLVQLLAAISSGQGRAGRGTTEARRTQGEFSLCDCVSSAYLVPAWLARSCVGFRLVARRSTLD